MFVYNRIRSNTNIPNALLFLITSKTKYRVSRSARTHCIAPSTEPITSVLNTA